VIRIGRHEIRLDIGLTFGSPKPAETAPAPDAKPEEGITPGQLRMLNVKVDQLGKATGWKYGKSPDERRKLILISSGAAATVDSVKDLTSEQAGTAIDVISARVDELGAAE